MGISQEEMELINNYRAASETDRRDIAALTAQAAKAAQKARSAIRQNSSE